MVIDSHVHFWKYEKDRDSKTLRENKVLQQDYLPETVAQTFARNGIDGCIAVESEPREVETRFLSELAATHPVIRGVVGWVELAAPDLEKKLDEFSEYAPVRGYRYAPQGDPNPKALENLPSLVARGLSLDLLAKRTDPQGVTKVFKAAPDLPIILDHCGSPDVNQPPTAAWKAMIAEVAKAPNAWCKVSGLLTGAAAKTWSAGQFYPFLDIIFEAFPVDRLLYGGDWPFLLLAGSYVQWKSLLEKYLHALVPEEQEKFWGGNAQTFYRI